MSVLLERNELTTRMHWVICDCLTFMSTLYDSIYQSRTVDYATRSKRQHELKISALRMTFKR